MTIKLWMVFEAVAPNKQGVENSLQDHIEMLSGDDGVQIKEKTFDEISEMENPHPGLEKGFSQVCEIRTEIDDFSKVIQTVINYGPTYVQIEGPDEINMDLKDAQESLQQVVDTMHQYANSGAGGMLISRASDE
ncbi:hypothetical protein [Candidatus Nanohalococcus occultus]|uniref:Uncharacterized protein n=1 Tax=Candidatus Nanohalococcus occultus TaxID=2978047 RepID=A0ABY8CDG9_9ARCH|nr:hypothetical protein SVXNc_0236 [Candidatus Nanohaloarchaeota archaeon SVXNc]